MSQITKKQQRFIEEYLIDLNATQAAIRAGYSSDTATEQGSRLLTNVKVRACIDRAMAERSKRTGVNADRVIQELARIAFVNPASMIDFDNASINPAATEDDLAALASVKVKAIPTAEGNGFEREIKLADKIKALELLGKHLGMFRERIDLEVKASETLDDIMSQLCGGKGLEE